MKTLVEKIVALHESLENAELPHAFGGALALAWCTKQARGTIDIDVNIFAEPTRTKDVIDALPSQITSDARQRATLQRDGQARLWWEQTPIDIFLDTTPIHTEAIKRTRIEKFAGTSVPFLSCEDLAVFKAFFNRTRDWADLEDMQAAGTLDVNKIIATLIAYIDVGDERIQRLNQLRSKV